MKLCGRKSSNLAGEGGGVISQGPPPHTDRKGYESAQSQGFDLLEYRSQCILDTTPGQEVKALPLPCDPGQFQPCHPAEERLLGPGLCTRFCSQVPLGALGVSLQMMTTLPANTVGTLSC